MQKKVPSEILTKSDFLTLLTSAYTAEAEVRTAFRQTMGRYSTILVAVIGGTLAGMQGTRSCPVLAVSFAISGGLVVLSMAFAAYCHFKSDFRRQVEWMSMQAKYEDILGLTDVRRCHALNFWKEEPIVPRYFVECRQKASDTMAFVNLLMRGPGSLAIKLYYVSYMVIGMALIALGCYMLFEGVVSGLGGGPSDFFKLKTG